MTFKVAAGVLSTLIGAALIAGARAHYTLYERVDQLERTNAEQERRITELQQAKSSELSEVKILAKATEDNAEAAKIARTLVDRRSDQMTAEMRNSLARVNKSVQLGIATVQQGVEDAQAAAQRAEQSKTDMEIAMAVEEAKQIGVLRPVRTHVLGEKDSKKPPYLGVSAP